MIEGVLLTFATPDSKLGPAIALGGGTAMLILLGWDTLAQWKGWK